MLFGLVSSEGFSESVIFFVCCLYVLHESLHILGSTSIELTTPQTMNSKQQVRRPIFPLEEYLVACGLVVSAWRDELETTLDSLQTLSVDEAPTDVWRNVSDAHH